MKRALLGTVVAGAVVLSCTDRIGPPIPLAGHLAIAPTFANTAAVIVPLAAGRFTIRRIPGGEVVRDTVVTFAAGTDSVDLTLTVPVLDPTEMFEVLIAMVTPAGDTAFRAGPVPVKPATSGPPPIVPVTFRYTGIGANAAGVAILTNGATVMSGESTLLVAQALDSAGAPIAGTPIEWVCLDTATAQVARPDSGRVVGKAQRGNARVMARLLTGQTDTTSVSVLLPPASLVAEAGSGQAAPAGTLLPDPLVARAAASDGVGVADEWIRFVVATGGGSLSADSVLTDAGGRAAVSWTLGNVVGSQIVQASTARLSGVTASFMATAQATGVGGIAIVSGDGQSAQVGTAVATQPTVRVTDAQGNPVPGVDVTFAVASGGGSVTGAAAVTDAAGLAAVGSWVLGPTVGINTLTVTADTLTPVMFTATATGPGGTVSMVVSAGDGQTALAGTAVAVAPAVIVRDAGSNPVPGVTVNFAVTAGGGSVTGAAALTDAGGIARVGSWTVGLGANSLTATLTGLPPVAFTATGTVGPADTVLVISGSGQSADAGTALPQPLVVEVQDSAGNGVAGVDVTWSTLTGSLAPATSTTNSAGRAQSDWTLGTNSQMQTATASVAGLTPAVFTATAVFPNPTILLELVGANRIRLGDSAFVTVTLTAPAPTGGVFVSVTSDNPAVVAVDTAGGGGVLVPVGETVGQVKLFGIGAGTGMVRANASGYSEGTLSVLVSVQVLSMPSTLNVPYGGQASLPIQISAPAPAGGTTVTLVSDNPGAVAVVTPSVVIPAGSQTTNAIVAGVTPGTATVTGSTTDFGTAQSSVSSTANLNIVQSSATIDETFGTQLTVQLESGGSPAAAPSPGLAVTMTPRDPACVAATSPVTIPTGLVSTTTDIAFGGGDVSTPCTTYLIAESPSIAPDSAFVRVNPAPGISVSARTVGTGLQRVADGSLGAANHGGVDVVITSSDPS
ncbi:MAG: hypothetical protein OER89_05575, partial [Gemmatimonadota bacterium]|nr:hypothetical protein [Gemmatimonadota bacterium]